MYPTLFNTGPFIVSTIWIFIITAIFVFTKLLIKAIQKKRDDFKLLYDNGSFIILSFIIGARLIHVIANFNYYFYEKNLREILGIFAFWDKGFSFWGGILTALGALFHVTRKNKESFKKWMDYVSEPFLYSLPILYVGKFFDGLGYGSKTDLPFGVAFKNMDIAIISPVHPTQLYGTFLFCIAILITKKFFDKKKDFLEIRGFKAAFITMLISVSIFVENLFRGDPAPKILDLRIHLYLSFIIIVVSGIYLWQLVKSHHGNK